MNNTNTSPSPVPAVSLEALQASPEAFDAAVAQAHVAEMKTYAVVSIKEIRAILKRAKAERTPLRSQRLNGATCVVMRFEVSESAPIAGDGSRQSKLVKVSY